jgi:hypothetical protein
MLSHGGSPAREAGDERPSRHRPSLVDRIKQTLVGLKMPRAIGGRAYCEQGQRNQTGHWARPPTAAKGARFA